MRKCYQFFLIVTLYFRWSLWLYVVETRLYLVLCMRQNSRLTCFRFFFWVIILVYLLHSILTIFKFFFQTYSLAVSMFVSFFLSACLPDASFSEKSSYNSRLGLLAEVSSISIQYMLVYICYLYIIYSLETCYWQYEPFDDTCRWPVD